MASSQQGMTFFATTLRGFFLFFSQRMGWPRGYSSDVQPSPRIRHSVSGPYACRPVLPGSRILYLRVAPRRARARGGAARERETPRARFMP